MDEEAAKAQLLGLIFLEAQKRQTERPRYWKDNDYTPILDMEDEVEQFFLHKCIKCIFMMFH